MNTRGVDGPTLAAPSGLPEMLREAGMTVGIQRIEGFFSATAALGGPSLRNLYSAGRATLCSSPDDLLVFDRCFAQFFLGVAQAPADSARNTTLRFHRFTEAGDGNAAEPESREQTRELSVASADEVLRQRDFSTMTDAEREEINRLIARLKPASRMRRSRRQQSATRGAIAVRQSVRASLRDGGDAIVLRYRQAKQRVRTCVFIIDVSGSMKPYADPLLRFALAGHFANARSTHLFAAGTRLTYLTPGFRSTTPERALDSASRAIPDWHGGTQLGEQLKAFLDRWGQRGLARGATVVIASDGFERGDAALLGEQMARLGRLAYRVVWCNPHKSSPGYEPLANGMRAAMSYVDDFLSGCSVAELAQLADAISGSGETPNRIRQ